MENLPQNENNTTEEFSTIFSDPAAHKEKSKSGKSKRILKVLSLLLVVAIIIGGTVAVIKLIPEKEDENISLAGEDIEVLSYDADDIKEITVKNKNGSFNIYSKVVEADDETTGETLTETYWYLKGYDTDLTDSATLQTLVNNAIDIDAIRIIDTKTAAECGFNNPQVTVNITDNDGKKIKVEIGDKSPDNAGVYVRTSQNEKIYLLGSMLDEDLTFTDLDLASTDAQAGITLGSKYKDYVSGENIIDFDKITVSGKNFPKDVVLTLSKDEKLSGFIPYNVISPMKRAGENGDTVLAIFSQGFPVAGAYSYDAEKATINKFGLNNPDFSVSATFDDYTYTYKFKKQKDGYYAFVGNDSKNVKKVSVEDCGFLTFSTHDFYNKMVYITSIDLLNNLKIETDGKVYDFSITPAAVKDESENKKYVIEYGGKIFNSTYFQSFYQFLCGLEAMDFEVEQTTQKPVLTITYVFNDKSQKPVKVEFVKINATKYQYSVDGVAMGKIGSSSFNKINKNLTRLLEGKQIVVN